MTTLNEQNPASFGTTIVSGADTSPSHPPLPLPPNFFLAPMQMGERKVEF